jgi:hypothetical protein
MNLREEKKQQDNVTLEGKEEKLINRKEALKKTGYIALSAATMMLLLNKPNKAVAGSSSPADPGGWPG